MGIVKLTIRVTNGSLSGSSFELYEGHLLIGRSPNCSVRFDPYNEKIVSTQHAFIEARADGFYIRDNQSTNGTFINGERVSDTRLNDGDILGLGYEGIKAEVVISSDSTESIGSAVTEDLGDESTLESVSPQAAGIAASAIEAGSVNLKGSSGMRETIGGFGLSRPEAAQPPQQIGKWIATGLMSLLIVFLILPVLFILFSSLGLVVAVVAGIVAFLPVLVYVLPILWLDRYDPEPPWLILLCFSWGAVVAVFASAIVNDIFTLVATISTQSAGLGQLAGAVVSAPLIEESTKGIGLVALLIFFRRHFDDVLDGIVLGGVIALGFATVENILYYGRGLLEEGVRGLALLFALRGMLSPFAHVTFTAMTGIGCGISRESHNSFVRIVMPVLGYILAVTLHAVWNGMGIVFMLLISGFGLTSYCGAVGLSGNYIGVCGFLIGYVILEIPLFLAFVGFSLFVMRRQNRILKEMLAIDVARGLIDQEHLDIATSAFRGLSWSLQGLTSGKFVSRRRYLRAIGKLGLSYWHIQRATAAQGHTASFQQNPFLRAEVEKYGALV